MSQRIPEVWRLLWPKSIPSSEYETAWHMAALAKTIGAKRELVVEASAPEEMISTTAAAKILGVTRDRAWKMARDGLLPSEQAGGTLRKSYRIKRSDVLAAKKARR